MVKIGLQIKANLENVTDIKADGEDFRWYMKLKCLSCGEIPEKWQYVSLEESVPVKGGKGDANLVAKCKLCSRENSIDIIKDSLQPYTAEHSNSFKTVVAFDCRGMEPVDFSPRVGWTCRGEESGSLFPEVSLTEKEWVDYDEKAQLSVGIYELEHKFVKV